MDANGAQTRLRDFVVQSLGKPNLTGSDDIFEIGEAPSLFSVELVLFFEETLGIPLDDEDLARDNFATIDAMGRLIAWKLGTP